MEMAKWAVYGKLPGINILDTWPIPTIGNNDDNNWERVQICGIERHYYVVSTHSIRRLKAAACESASSVSWCGGAGGVGEMSVPTESSSRSSSIPPVDSTTSQPVITHHITLQHCQHQPQLTALGCGREFVRFSLCSTWDSKTWEPGLFFVKKF